MHDHALDSTTGARSAELGLSSLRYAMVAVAVALLAAAGGGASTYVHRPSADCLASAERRAALDRVVSQPAAPGRIGVGSALPRPAFRCHDLREPAGVLLSAAAEEGGTYVWFVDTTGTVFDVNLSTRHLTPSLPSNPALTPPDLLQPVR